jgi:hypothetical protein
MSDSECARCDEGVERGPDPIKHQAAELCLLSVGLDSTSCLYAMANPSDFGIA